MEVTTGKYSDSSVLKLSWYGKLIGHSISEFKVNFLIRLLIGDTLHVFWLSIMDIFIAEDKHN